MSELAPCETCRRHIRVSESACPFCEGQTLPRSRRSPARRALLTGALVGASALGCSDERPATQAPPPVAAPPPAVVIDAALPNPIDAALVEPTDASAPDAGAADAALAKKRKKKATRNGPKDSINLLPDRTPPPPMPYGAPPARRRLV